MAELTHIRTILEPMVKMMTSKNVSKQDGKKDNDSKALVLDNDVHEVVANMAGLDKDKKLKQFFLYWYLGNPPQVAATLSGYAGKYGYKLVTKYRNDTNLRERIDKIFGRMPGQYKNWCKARLLKVATIEDGFLDKCLKDPTLAGRNPKLLSDIKRSSGALEDDKPSGTQINIKELTMAQTVLNQYMDTEAAGGDAAERGQIIDMPPEAIEEA